MRLFQQQTHHLTWHFDFMPVASEWDEVWSGLRFLREDIRHLSLWFFPHFSRLLSLLPSLQRVDSLTIDWYEYVLVAEHYFIELTAPNDEALLKLGDEILTETGNYNDIIFELSTCLITYPRSDIFRLGNLDWLWTPNKLVSF